VREAGYSGPPKAHIPDLRPSTLTVLGIRKG
jgi:hypothetical protein